MKTVSDYILSEDIVTNADSSTIKTPIKLLHQQYLKYCRDNHTNAFPLPLFARQLRALGFTLRRSTGNKTYVYYSYSELPITSLKP